MTLSISVIVIPAVFDVTVSVPVASPKINVLPAPGPSISTVPAVMAPVAVPVVPPILISSRPLISIDSRVMFVPELISSSVGVPVSLIAAACTSPAVAVSMFMPAAPSRSIAATVSFKSRLPVVAVKSTFCAKSIAESILEMVNAPPEVTSTLISAVNALFNVNNPPPVVNEVFVSTVILPVAPSLFRSALMVTAPVLVD